MKSITTPNEEKMHDAFNSIMPIFNELTSAEMIPIICTMIDVAAGLDGRTGYELLNDLLPVIKAVNDNLGVLE